MLDIHLEVTKLAAQKIAQTSGVIVASQIMDIMFVNFAVFPKQMILLIIIVCKTLL